MSKPKRQVNAFSFVSSPPFHPIPNNWIWVSAWRCREFTIKFWKTNNVCQNNFIFARLILLFISSSLPFLKILKYFFLLELFNDNGIDNDNFKNTISFVVFSKVSVVDHNRMNNSKIATDTKYRWGVGRWLHLRKEHIAGA